MLRKLFSLGLLALVFGSGCATSMASFNDRPTRPNPNATYVSKTSARRQESYNPHNPTYAPATSRNLEANIQTPNTPIERDNSRIPQPQSHSQNPIVMSPAEIQAAAQARIKARLESMANTEDTQKPVSDSNGNNYRTADFSGDSEEVALARMLFGEARNCSDDEMYAVACSAINRSKDGKAWNGEGSIKEVVLKPWQYSCFNDEDPNREKLMNPEAYDKESWNKSLRIARSAIKGEKPKFDKGQTHYFNPDAANPDWADKLDLIEFPGYKFRHTFRRED